MVTTTARTGDTKRAGCQTACHFCSPLRSQSEEIAGLKPQDTLVEYKWDGIRAQLIKTDQTIRLWSRGDQDITEQFPDIVDSAVTLPSPMILDGEILAGTPGQLQSFNQLQTRLNRKRITQTLLNTHPAFFKAYDLLRFQGEDMRDQPLAARQAVLETIAIQQSPVLCPRTRC